MSKFSPEEIARVRRESERLLCDPPARPEPEPVREVPLPPRDEVREWREWQDARTAEREAHRAALRREQREEHEAMARARALDGAEARIEALEGRMDEIERQISELSRAIQEFSRAVTGGLNSQDRKLEKLQTLLTELRTIDDLQRRAPLDLPGGFIRKERTH